VNFPPIKNLLIVKIFSSIQKKMHLEASYYNKQGNKIELEEELVPNVNKVDSKKPTTKKQRREDALR
jgi:hypothetical protein